MKADLINEVYKMSLSVYNSKKDKKPILTLLYDDYFYIPLIAIMDSIIAFSSVYPEDYIDLIKEGVDFSDVFMVEEIELSNDYNTNIKFNMYINEKHITSNLEEYDAPVDIDESEYITIPNSLTNLSFEEFRYAMSYMIEYRHKIYFVSLAEKVFSREFIVEQSRDLMDKVLLIPSNKKYKIY